MSEAEESPGGDDEVHESVPNGEAAFAPSAIALEIDEEVPEQAKLPDGFGQHFRTMDAFQYAAVMRYVREWVEWLRLEFALTTGELPACWFQHSDIRYELYAMCIAEYKVWASGETTTMPAFAFLPQLDQMRNRLRGRSDRCNVARMHVEAEMSPFVVDEEAWADQLRRVSSTD
jgi:hypothetical protein